MNLARIFVIAFLVFSITLASNVMAVTSDLLGNVTIEINPTYPKPGERALASVNTYSLDLDRTEITWLVNGSVVKQGIGEKSIGFNVGKAGTSTKIEVRVSSQSLGELSDTITLTAGEVDLLWESNTYTPQFGIEDHPPCHTSYKHFGK
jgi:hypothetical protein